MYVLIETDESGKDSDPSGSVLPVCSNGQLVGLDLSGRDELTGLRDLYVRSSPGRTYDLSWTQPGRTYGGTVGEVPPEGHTAVFVLTNRAGRSITRQFYHSPDICKDGNDSTPGGDHPDDNHSAASVPIPAGEFFALPEGARTSPQVAILQRGAAHELWRLVLQLGEPAVRVETDFDPVTTVQAYPALLVPSGGLYGLENSPAFTKHSARAFLLALRAKGYHPRVIVTDLRPDYADVVAQVFPNVVHHECIFHALQDVHKHLKDAYGSNYAQKHPHVAALRDDINSIFDVHTKRTAWRRYEKVLAQREAFVSQTPDAAVVFDFLERHWLTLVDAIESRHIPSTNNATEEVIRIFNQHYKTFCGFESIESARLYLGVFEKVYRFTPFSDDAQERIRGKCPLELAGYEVRKLPMAHLFRGLALQRPAAVCEEVSLT